MNAEVSFLKNLEELHRDFPNLKIVLEHATTKESIELVSLNFFIKKKIYIFYKKFIKNIYIYIYIKVKLIH